VMVEPEVMALMKMKHGDASHGCADGRAGSECSSAALIFGKQIYWFAVILAWQKLAFNQSGSKSNNIFKSHLKIWECLRDKRAFSIPTQSILLANDTKTHSISSRWDLVMR